MITINKIGVDVMKNLLRIKRWRAGLKQSELAEMLKCNSSYISLVENSRIEATEDFKRKAATVLSSTVSDIFPDRVRMRAFL